jgi:hypothetical protein
MRLDECFLQGNKQFVIKIRYLFMVVRRISINLASQGERSCYFFCAKL